MQFSAFKQLVLSRDNNEIQSEGGHFQSYPLDATAAVPQPHGPLPQSKGWDLGHRRSLGYQATIMLPTHKPSQLL